MTQRLDLPKDGMKSWWYTRNTKSIDGLPGLNVAFHVEGSLISRRHSAGNCEGVNLKDGEAGGGRHRGADVFMIGLGIGVGIGTLLTKLLFLSRRP